ncbi:MAG: C40 family peptidase [Marinosulfonomonas sp.]|nr:C40 family peptidase [Marinosulfonomonas sp.]
MTDHRLTPANARVAAAHLKGQIKAAKFVSGTWRQISVPVADILSAPQGPRDRQALYGDHILVLEEHDGYAFGQAAKDGYVGYINADHLAAAQEPTHWVSAPATHLYTMNDFKSREAMALSFGSYLTIVAAHERFFETSHGYFVPKQHLREVGTKFSDPIDVAALFLGSPYLWGGNSRAGLDCSALVQASLLACGISCPADSDMQENTLGTLTNDTEMKRGDLLFWKGHVAMVVDSETMIHANAGAMATVYEPIKDAIARIKEQGDGPVTSHKRL